MTPSSGRCASTWPCPRAAPRPLPTSPPAASVSRPLIPAPARACAPRREGFSSRLPAPLSRPPALAPLPRCGRGERARASWWKPGLARGGTARMQAVCSRAPRRWVALSARAAARRTLKGVCGTRAHLRAVPRHQPLPVAIRVRSRGARHHRCGVGRPLERPRSRASLACCLLASSPPRLTAACCDGCSCPLDLSSQRC